jgi:hypothetical protein
LLALPPPRSSNTWGLIPGLPDRTRKRTAFI